MKCIYILNEQKERERKINRICFGFFLLRNTINTNRKNVYDHRTIVIEFVFELRHKIIHYWLEGVLLEFSFDGG